MTTDPAARTDADLLAAHVAGDPEAFGELFSRHQDRLWAVAMQVMGNPEDAADGLQDAMLAAYRRAGSFRGESAVTTWLHRVVVNACLDRLRAAKVRATTAWPEEFEPRIEIDHHPDGDPAESVDRAETRRIVMAALDTLPAVQRTALVLVDMEGYSVAEVASMLDLPTGTVKSRCSRGRSRLAAILPRNLGGLADVPSPRAPDRQAARMTTTQPTETEEPNPR